MQQLPERMVHYQINYYFLAQSERILHSNYYWLFSYNLFFTLKLSN